MLGLENFYFERDYIFQQANGKGHQYLTDGKKIRSKLLELFGNFFSIETDVVKKLSRIIELTHNATLVHDDVIDQSFYRRDHETFAKIMGNKKSILLGDYMLAKALFELNELKRSELMHEITLSLKDLVEGEWIQYDSQSPYQMSYELYVKLATKKTGALLRWCTHAPACMAKNLTVKKKNLLKNFGEQLGIVYQMMDDIRDFKTDTEKSYALDFKNNNPNFVFSLTQINNQLEKLYLETDSFTALSELDATPIHKAIEQAKLEVEVRLESIYEMLAEIESLNTNYPLSELKSFLELILLRIS